MNQDKIIQLKKGLSTAFINKNHSSNLAFKPQFVSNNYKEGRKVISGKILTTDCSPILCRFGFINN